MASVEDRWYTQRHRADGRRELVPTARHGRGSRWLLRWRDDNGTHRKKAYARKADADRAAAEIAAGIAATGPARGPVTFRAFAEQWRAHQFDDPLTAEQAELRLRLHINPVLGDLPLTAITPSTIRQWLHGLRMSRSYQRALFANVSQILSAAVAGDLILKNPCRSPTVRKPVVDPRRVVPWPAEWVIALRAALPARYAILVTLGAGLGLRQGEIFGLSPDDVDHAGRQIEIRRQVKLSHGNHPYLAPPKGRKTRTLPLPATVADALREHLAAFPAETVTLPWDRPDGVPVTVQLLLTSREHGALHRNYVNRAIWKAALAASNIPPTRETGSHALRHYHASILLDGGESLRTVSDRLGHADPAFTLRTYTHLIPDSRARTNAIVDATLRHGSTPHPAHRAPPPPQLGR